MQMSSRWFLWLFLPALAFHSPTFGQSTTTIVQKTAPELRTALSLDGHADILVIFSEKADLQAASRISGKADKARFVFLQLQTVAEKSQARARQLLRARNAFFNSFYIVNALAVSQADAATVEALAQLPEVAWMAPDPTVALQLPAPDVSSVAVERGATEWGIENINAPAVWALGYRGQGITVGGADTGYEWEHPALKTHYRGYNSQDGSANHTYNWHDGIHEISPLSGDSIPDPANNPCGVSSKTPCDDHNHGTHTMGTMVGDDGAGNQIGVAPEASWVACRNMERGNGKPSSYIECFEWFLAPTDLNGENPNVEKAPHVINNSWYCSYQEGCTDLSVNELMRQAVINLRASGVFVVVSVGNDGSQGCNSANNPPAYFEESFSVGAISSNDTITNFSSRGAVIIDGSNRLKPNVVAPGAGVRSSIRNGGYSHFWGTSMAGPHVAGMVALILSARPDLAGEVELLEDIIEQTAVPSFDTVNCGGVSGQAHPNNTYGFGRVDALAAVLKAQTVSPVQNPASNPANVTLAPNPVRDAANFILTNFSGPARLELFDATGRLVIQQNRSETGASLRWQVAMRDFPAGTYFWKISGDTQVFSGKFIKL